MYEFQFFLAKTALDYKITQAGDPHYFGPRLVRLQNFGFLIRPTLYLGLHFLKFLNKFHPSPSETHYTNEMIFFFLSFGLFNVDHDMH